MKKQFSDEQTISILREADPGVQSGNSAASMPFQTPPFTFSVRISAEWKSLKWSGSSHLKRIMLVSGSCSLKPGWIRGYFRWLWAKISEDRPEAGSRGSYV
ncbi:hypothetical protein GCM10009414_32130 [Tatumella terrea]